MLSLKYVIFSYNIDLHENKSRRLCTYLNFANILLMTSWFLVIGSGSSQSFSYHLKTKIVHRDSHANRKCI